MTKCVERPGNRLCAACGRPMSENAKYWFAADIDRSVQEIRVICARCYNGVGAGWGFDADGNVVWETAEVRIERVKQERRTVMA